MSAVVLLCSGVTGDQFWVCSAEVGKSIKFGSAVGKKLFFFILEGQPSWILCGLSCRNKNLTWPVITGMETWLSSVCIIQCHIWHY